MCPELREKKKKTTIAMREEGEGRKLSLDVSDQREREREKAMPHNVHRTTWFKLLKENGLYYVCMDQHCTSPEERNCHPFHLACVSAVPGQDHTCITIGNAPCDRAIGIW